MKRIVGLIVVMGLMTGCASYYNKYDSLHKWWDVDYKEEVKIQTEPDGCRIYFQEEYIGTSPLVHNVNWGDVKITQTGTRSVQYKQDYLLILPMSDLPTGVTNDRWDSELKPTLIKQGFYTITAMCDGYYPETRRIEANIKDPVFQKAISELKVDVSDKIKSPRGYRSVLLTPKPKAVIPNKTENTESSGGSPQQQQQQQTVVVPGMVGASTNDCIHECKIMKLKGELKTTLEECYKMLCD